MKLVFRPVYTGCTKGESAADPADFWTCKQISVGGTVLNGFAPDSGRNLPLNYINRLRKETHDVPSGVL